MRRTKRGLPDYRRAPTTEELRNLSGFSYKDSDEGLRITFTKTHADDPKRATAWNASVHRNVNGQSKTFVKYAGTDRTLPRRFNELVADFQSKITP